MRLIDADALLERMKKAMESGRNLNGTFHLYIEHAPTITRPTGEWVDRSEGGRIMSPWWESHKCDQCGYYGSGAWNFCPNCGVKMKGEEDD